MRSRGGFALIMALLTCSILMVVAIGFLSSRAGQYQASLSAVQSTQALWLAQSGLEDATQKLCTDANFPPPDAGNSQLFGYGEQLDAEHSYRVLIDRRLAGFPWRICRVTSTGLIGPADRPVAQRTLRYELDLAASRPTYFKIYQLYDEGAI